MTTITVTAQHMAKGIPEDRECCPVALAILDAIPAARGIAVADVISLSFSEDEWTEISVPREALDFIRAFDSGERVEPFTFTLDCPEVTP